MHCFLCEEVEIPGKIKRKLRLNNTSIHTNDSIFKKQEQLYWQFQKPSHLKMRIVLLSFVTKDFAVKNDCKLQMSCAQNWNVTQLLAVAES